MYSASTSPEGVYRFFHRWISDRRKQYCLQVRHLQVRGLIFFFSWIASKLTRCGFRILWKVDFSILSFAHCTTDRYWDWEQADEMPKVTYGWLVPATGAGAISCTKFLRPNRNTKPPLEQRRILARHRFLFFLFLKYTTGAPQII